MRKKKREEEERKLYLPPELIGPSTETGKAKEADESTDEPKESECNKCS